MDQMHMYNAKGVIRSDKPTDTPLSSMELLSVFQLIDLILLSATSLLWFSLTALSVFSGNCFYEKALTHPLYATCPTPNNRQV